MSILNKNDKSKQKGLIGVCRAMYEYTQQGYTVLQPLIDANKYDFVIEKNNVFQRVQVKTSTHISPNNAVISYDVVLESRGNRQYNSKKFQVGDYDLLFVMTELGDCWSIPATEITSTTSLTVGTVKYSRYKI